MLCVIRVDTLDEAIEIVNASRFGNGTSIFTESGASVRRYRHEVRGGHDRRQHRRRRAGRVLPVLAAGRTRFLGDLHAHGPDAVEFFTRKKTVTSRWFSSGQGSGSYFVEK